MKRHRLQRSAAVAIVMSICGVVLAQSVPAPSPSPGLPSTSRMPATATPGLPASGLPPSATQSTPPPANPAAPTYGGQGYGGQGYAPTPAPASPMTAAPGPVPDARTLSRSDDPSRAFHALDQLNRGFVTRADTDKIPGFMGFDNADTDRDGRLTPDEFQNAWRFFAQ
jgi:hypothetical protein